MDFQGYNWDIIKGFKLIIQDGHGHLLPSRVGIIIIITVQSQDIIIKRWFTASVRLRMGSIIHPFPQ